MLPWCIHEHVVLKHRVNHGAYKHVVLEHHVTMVMNNSSFGGLVTMVMNNSSFGGLVTEDLSFFLTFSMRS